MHPNPAFRGATEAFNLDFAREQGFGMLAVASDSAPLISHLPFLLNAAGDVAEFHLVRSNPIARLGGAPARLAVQGPHTYISPDWYRAEDQVPTWNYVAVHLVGKIEPRPEAELRDLLDRQSEAYEARLLPKTPWTADKMTDGLMERMMRQIVPFRMHVSEVHGTWKLGQNKPEAARLSAADHVDAYGMGQETALMAALMRGAQ
ncbi:negative transcriptional regulator, PaiB family [Roseovarius nanhaiticus]|uniref:Negative transcriptional regulator, PaiB family n=1 Tax=Roseovarius nanhaiticus TaxID=573024 RepID=A0A1N7ECP0_9RHOB|nr:FMN-binding negative transcriptional regulator [Roseovarius nanhaiticus]SEK77477.1 negative transcriptional regulator, PaiB family [Roseovarius nanhaiticus]SIR85847.1 negative transcriptional regulator, PaiB family [Roseovarius nanhaiticus]